MAISSDIDQMIIRDSYVKDKKFVEIFIGGRFIKFWCKETEYGSPNEKIYIIEEVAESNTI